MPRSRDSALLGYPATPEDEADLRRMLEQIGKRRPGAIRDRLTRRFESTPTFLTRAMYLFEEALSDLSKYGKIDWLNGKFATGDVQPDFENDPGTPTSAAVFEAGLELSNEELVSVAHALLAAVEQRQQQRKEAEAAERTRTLSELRELTALSEETKRRIELQVVRAREMKASWTEIGDACGIKRETAHKRWAAMAEAALGEGDDVEA